MIQKIVHLIQEQWQWRQICQHFKSALSWTNSWWYRQFQKTQSNHNKKETVIITVATTPPYNSATHPEKILRVNQPQANLAQNTNSAMNLREKIRLHEPQHTSNTNQSTLPTITFEELNRKLIHLLRCMKDLSNINKQFREFFMDEDILNIHWPENLSPIVRIEQYEQCYSKVIELDINDYWDFPDPNCFQSMIYRGPDVPRIFRSDKRITNIANITQGSSTPNTSKIHDIQHQGGINNFKHKSDALHKEEENSNPKKNQLNKANQELIKNGKVSKNIPIPSRDFSANLDKKLNVSMAVQPTRDVIVPAMDQISIYAKIMKNQTWILHKPNSTFMLTSENEQGPNITDGLYSINRNNFVKLTITNTTTKPLILNKTTPIPGILAHNLTQEYNKPIKITKNNTLVLKNRTIKASKQSGVVQPLSDDNGMPLLEKQQTKILFTLPINNAQYSWPRRNQEPRRRFTLSSTTYQNDTRHYLKTIQLMEKLFANGNLNKMKLNSKICQFDMKDLPWLGYNLSTKNTQPHTYDLQAIISKMIPRTITNSTFHRGLFNLPNSSLPFQMFIDTCKTKPHKHLPTKEGIVAILTQVQDGSTKAIGYFFEQRISPKRSHDTYNADLYGLVAGSEHFMTYIKNSKMTVFTNHMPLLKLPSRNQSTSKALLSRLSAMNFNIIHINGQDIPKEASSKIAQQAISAHLKTAPSLIIQTPPSIMGNSQWKHEQSIDPNCIIIGTWLNTNEQHPSPDMKEIIKLYGPLSGINPNNGLLYINFNQSDTKQSNKLWVPEGLQPVVISKTHEPNHWIMKDTYESIARTYFWPSMKNDIDNYIKSCKVCTQHTNTYKKRHYSDMDSNTETTPKKIKTAMMISLECPVCLEVPRIGTGLAIYGCRNGHILCQCCVEKIQECPVCREKDIYCRNLFAEKFIQDKFRDVPLKCKYLGCAAQLPMTDDKLIKHEKFCPHREVPCPSTQRRTCHWKGPLTSLMTHMKDKKCVQVIFAVNWTNNHDHNYPDINFPKFKSNLGDFPDTAPSVFQRANIITYWKPIVLLAKNILNVCCYILVQRDSRGLWTFMTYSMLPRDSLDHIKAIITIESPNNTRKFTFETKVLSFETSREEAIKLGQYMCLQDSQIKPFKQIIKDKTSLFHYTVEIHADPVFLDNINEEAYIKKTVPNPTRIASDLHSKWVKHNIKQ